MKTISELRYDHYFDAKELSKMKRLYDAIDNACVYRPIKQAPVLSDRDLMKVSTLRTVKGSELDEMKFFVVITTALSLRPGELSNLKSTDIERRVPSGSGPFAVVVSLRETKTAKLLIKETDCIFGCTSESTCDDNLTGEPLCPAHALWRKKLLCVGNSQIFDGSRINSRLKSFSEEIRLDCVGLTAYSGRRTGTQKLIACGVGEEEIQVGTGWKSAGMVATYGREQIQEKARSHAKTILNQKSA
jgi:hypothetical protein